MPQSDVPQGAPAVSADADPHRRAIDNPERSRYELVLDGRLAGFVTYAMVGGVLVLDHAEVDRARRGEGLGGALVRDVLDDLLRRGLVIEPRCPFVADFIEAHPEYAGMVARSRS